MNKIPQVSYSGYASTPLALGQTKQLLEFQEKRREYIDQIQKQRRDEVVSRIRQLVMDNTKNEEDEDSAMGNQREPQNSEQTEKRDEDQMGNEDPLHRVLERMDFERSDNDDEDDNTESDRKKEG